MEIHTWHEIYVWRYIRGLRYQVEDTLEDIRAGGGVNYKLIGIHQFQNLK